MEYKAEIITLKIFQVVCCSRCCRRLDFRQHGALNIVPVTPDIRRDLVDLVRFCLLGLFTSISTVLVIFQFPEFVLVLALDLREHLSRLYSCKQTPL